MSQAGLVNINQSGGSGSPIETITGDNGGAIPPTSNNIFLLGDSSDTDNSTGIEVDGNAGTSSLRVTLTNRVVGSIQTINSTPTTIITFPATSVGTYIFELKLSAYNSTDTLGAGYNLFGTARSNGVNAFVVGTPDKIVNEEAGMALADVNMTVSGTNVLFTVTGLAGKTIDWCSVGLYCFVSP